MLSSYGGDKGLVDKKRASLGGVEGGFKLWEEKFSVVVEHVEVLGARNACNGHLRGHLVFFHVVQVTQHMALPPAH